ncbi:MAG: IS66 family transposase, partial [Aquiluna sp.]
MVAALSTTNLVRDEELKKKFNITSAGCAAHARRPFFRYAEHEPEASIEILDNFKFIFEVERIVQGASPQQIEAMRSHAECGALPIW